MEEMRQDIARIQRAINISRPTSIDRRRQASIDSHLPASIDNRLPALVDDNPPHSQTMKSQPDFHTREEIYQLCFDFKKEAIQGELVEIQSYIARQPEASTSIDKCNNKLTDIHRQTSVDEASNRGRLVQKVTSDMSDTHNSGEDISADTYVTVMRHQFNLESLGDRLQKIKDATTIMKDKWRRGDEAMRDFTGPDTCLKILASCDQYSQDHGFDPLSLMVYRYLEQAPEMTIELDHRSILREKYRSMFTSEHRSTGKRAESSFGHSRHQSQVFTNLLDYP
ncbi:hypothetical protein F2Q69_00059699 [Brassica cretica]|uniref:Uncharacterized protein n=1 Tax=Brassica cretica TaxID=69181 RepID=A0A8S9RPB4_BRACR|nr:hypothetical protein F2Q69_00059699 [Brassica cretica]